MARACADARRRHRRGPRHSPHRADRHHCDRARPWRLTRAAVRSCGDRAPGPPLCARAGGVRRSDGAPLPPDLRPRSPACRPRQCLRSVASPARGVDPCGARLDLRQPDRPGRHAIAAAQRRPPRRAGCRARPGLPRRGGDAGGAILHRCLAVAIAQPDRADDRRRGVADGDRLGPPRPAERPGAGRKRRDQHRLGL